MLMEIMKGAKRPNNKAYMAFSSNLPLSPFPSIKFEDEIMATQDSIRKIPIKNLNSNFSLNKNLKMIEVKMQYVAKKAVMIPWFILAFYAKLKAKIIEN